ncbi:uncharacterized protein LACBIDRAFT_331911 [Laccaria bicolor S238N-H82]|uniref:Predicted protein n=1 Tax=Laccaria bicolor (strain S238N-H82 / ATCC MYA-4686) TaxID=486041 RepID=B0DR09_LACBS|nr:uncharacterized protein LACBIDRAFT_331911 [Laccaria bicolor S238N-H82]EDR02981.1 predicted protein [Laccaria bicolor S238N-H82]|eukprot:XP_001886404.1 predicted protein [Laccaria bicolor S238N-H82]
MWGDNVPCSTSTTTASSTGTSPLTSAPGSSTPTSGPTLAFTPPQPSTSISITSLPMNSTVMVIVSWHGWVVRDGCDGSANLKDWLDSEDKKKSTKKLAAKKGKATREAVQKGNAKESQVASGSRSGKGKEKEKAKESVGGKKSHKKVTKGSVEVYIQWKKSHKKVTKGISVQKKYAEFYSDPIPVDSSGFPQEWVGDCKVLSDAEDG